MKTLDPAIERPIPGGQNIGCHSCAFRAGSETRSDSLTVLKGEVCALGGVPFFCHIDKHGFDFHDGDHTPGREFLVICEGFRARVREAAKDPRWHKNRRIRRAMAQHVIDSMNQLDTAGQDPEIRRELIRQIGDAVEYLAIPPKPSVEGASGQS